jgi:dTDP-4-amino-4,6-dideoxy-D-galactose acyltransferase
LRFEKDQWLSDVLGMSSWKVLGLEAASAAEIRHGLLDRAGGDTSFFFSKISTHDVGALTNAALAGFFVVDVNVTFDWRETSGDGSKDDMIDNSDVTIEVARAGDTSVIENIAGHCFTFSRFHLDPAVGRGRANEVKRQWARNACRGRASVVYVARASDNDVIGFLAVLESTSNKGKDAIIDLIGVDAARQGRGAGRALSGTFVEQWHDRADRLRVGTQISNIPAMRLYESIGFRMAETSYVVHAHVRNGAA